MIFSNLILCLNCRYIVLYWLDCFCNAYGLKTDAFPFMIESFHDVGLSLPVVVPWIIFILHLSYALIQTISTVYLVIVYYQLLTCSDWVKIMSAYPSWLMVMHQGRIFSLPFPKIHTPKGYEYVFFWGRQDFVSSAGPPCRKQILPTPLLTQPLSTSIYTPFYNFSMLCSLSTQFDYTIGFLLTN